MVYPFDTTLLPFTKTFPPSIKGITLLLEVLKARAMILSRRAEATVPVSYTHLDVYKRQKELMGGMGINSIEALRGNRLMLRGIGLTKKELEILGISHAGEC